MHTTLFINQIYITYLFRTCKLFCTDFWQINCPSFYFHFVFFSLFLLLQYIYCISVCERLASSHRTLGQYSERRVASLATIVFFLACLLHRDGKTLFSKITQVSKIIWFVLMFCKYYNLCFHIVQNFHWKCLGLQQQTFWFS